MAVETIVEWLQRSLLAGEGGVMLPGEGKPREIGWKEVAARACRAADALARLGVGAGDRVAIAAGNSLEWIEADFAIQMLGGVVVPLHISLAASQLAWQLQHSGSRLLVAEAGLVNKLPELPADLNIVSFDTLAGGNEAAGRERWAVTRRNVSPQTLASIVYTSGTSGEPRGVMLTQGNLAANAAATLDAFGRQDDDLRLNMLPFSHAFGRMSDLYVSLVANTRLALARSRESLIADARQVQPTLLVVVPLLLARLKQAAIAQFGADDSSAIQKLLGGRLRGFICGGAALADEVHEYFAGQGTPVYEGYGLTEAAPVVSASSAQASSPRGAAGRLLPGTEGKTAADGELLIRGPQVMAGYWQDEPATSAAIQHGWLHTGDLGTVDAEGFLTLHGRKKEFIALASGKKIWPAAIEAFFAGDPLIEQIMLVGEGEAALGAFVVLKDRAAAELNSADNRQRVLKCLAERLSERAAHEQVRRVWLLPEPWTTEREELTPKLTLRRAVILGRYADCVRQMFAT
ncbi:AMP-dependent synthetase/ligase [Anatilimnocola floriformis]|uniref:AMP-dependent synthetase/ligase n=1 Tax=Anatilimnocola floriformis TaxID=2948575 RepID=UPI0020C5AE06|nr:AMP-binding protein [Anatilimnocola floriformis]